MLLQIGLDAGLVQAIIALLGVYIVIMTGVIGWFLKELLQLKKDFYRLDQSLRGTEDKYDEGLLGRNYSDLKHLHSRLDTIDSKIDSVVSGSQRDREESMIAVLDAVTVLTNQLKQQSEDIEKLYDSLQNKEDK